MTTTYFGEELEHESELERRRALERVYDPASQRLLDEVVRVAPGWRCARHRSHSIARGPSAISG